jgi:hypothetical protein
LDFSSAPAQGRHEALTQAFFTGNFILPNQYADEVKAFGNEFEGQSIFEQLNELTTERVDSHGRFFLGSNTGTNNAPDVSTIPPGYGLHAGSAEALAELKPWTTGNAFSDSNCGQVVRFGGHLLDAQPRRTEVSMALTDCQQVMFIRLRHKQSADRTVLPHIADFTVPYTLRNQDGLGNKLLRGLLTTLFHHPECALSHQPDVLLDSGSTSQVFSVKDAPDLVIKIVWDSNLATAEVAALQKLHGVDNIIQLREHSNAALLLFPKAERSTATAALEGHMNPAHLASVVRALEACHSRGVFHRDVRPGNILCTSGTCTLADFGSATCSHEPALYSTPMLFRIDGEFARVQFEPAHDLLALVKSVYLVAHQPKVPKLATADPKWVQQFWADNLNAEPWSSMVASARAADYARLEKLITEYTPVRFDRCPALMNYFVFLGAVLRVRSSLAARRDHGGMRREGSTAVQWMVSSILSGPTHFQGGRRERWRHHLPEVFSDLSW